MICKNLHFRFHNRKFERPSSAELSDFGCFLIMACGVALLQLTGMGYDFRSWNFYYILFIVLH